ncbi:MarR family transcriptional regulator [Blastococcus sp. TF02-9]|uniref:MarR family winged helix-turn-helix transcriptional regulator n=1 Tax=Blastococcus sp. TF02-09 TaxID=2250576 RepID=UPI001314C45A|nr:MarR family transcriptional regulator [Blastococcus sp. TF02-9]
MRQTAVEVALLGAVRAIMRVSLHAADEIGTVSVVQLRALTVLSETGECNLAGLAQGVGVTVSTTSRLVDRLVAAELVERRRSPRTAREVVITLTPRGRATLERYDQLRMDDLRRSLDVLDGAETEAALKLLRAIGAAGDPTAARRDEAGPAAAD